MVLQGIVETNIEHGTFSGLRESWYSGEIGEETKASRQSPGPIAACLRNLMPTLGKRPREVRDPARVEDNSARRAVLHSLAGDSNSAASNTKNVPSVPERPRMHVLTGARGTDAQFAVFNFVTGDQYGFAQPQAKTAATPPQSTRQEWYLESESLC